MYQHQRIVIDIDDAAVWRYGLGDLMCVLGCGQAGADIEELADAALSSEEPHRPGEERPVRTGSRHYLRAAAEHLLCSMAIGAVMIFATQPVAINTGRMWHRRIKRGIWRGVHELGTPPLGRRERTRRRK